MERDELPKPNAGEVPFSDTGCDPIDDYSYKTNNPSQLERVRT